MAAAKSKAKTEKAKTEKAVVVTGPLATPYLDTGERIYLYEGARLPDNLREGEVERLTDLGLVGEADVAAEPDESGDGEG